MRSDEIPAEKTLLCLGFDELAAVADRLDYKSLGRLSCVSKGLRESLSAMDSVWAAKCAECIAAHRFNPKKLKVQPRALRDFLGLADHKQLCIALHQLPACPVGLWYRTDELAQPRGEIVAVYAHEDGTYHMSPLDYTDEVIQKHRHPNQISLLSELKGTFTPPRTPGLQNPRPKTPPIPELPAHLPDHIVNPILRAQQISGAQDSQYAYCQHMKARSSRVVSSADQAALAPAHTRPAMCITGANEAGCQVPEEGQSRAGSSFSKGPQVRHARSKSTENTMNPAAPEHRGSGLDNLHRWEDTAQGSGNKVSCSTSTMHGCHKSRMHSCTSNAATDTHATVHKDACVPLKPLMSPGLATEAAVADSDWEEDNPQTSIAVQWGLLDTANAGDTLGDRLVAEYQVGPCMAPSTMAAVGFTPQLHGPAAYMPYSLPCVVRRFGHRATGAPDTGSVGAPSWLADPTDNAHVVPASATAMCPPGKTLLSRASAAHPQSILFCSVLWPARLAPGPPPPPLAPGLEQSPAEMEASNTMCVTVVGPLPTDSEARGPAPAPRAGGNATQVAQLGFRSPLDWANKRYIQLLDQHLLPFLHRGSDARVISSYFTGSWTIIHPTLTPCNGDCGLPTCSRCTTQSMSSALSTDVTFLSIQPGDTLASARNTVAPLEPGEWGSDDDQGAMAVPITASNGHTRAHMPSAASSVPTPTTLKGVARGKPPLAIPFKGDHTFFGVDREGAAWEASSACNGCRGASWPTSPNHRSNPLSEEPMEDLTLIPPHGAVSMEFRRLRVDPACMTERARMQVLGSMPRIVTASGSGPSSSSSAADACMCLEGLWHGLYSGHGPEVLELSVVRAGEGPCVLPPHLLDSYCNLGVRSWPVPPWHDQVHIMKLRGDSNVPACQLSLLVDLEQWQSGSPDWTQFNLPLYFLRQLNEEDDLMEVWPHDRKNVLASCDAWCQINKEPGIWAPEWVAAKMFVIEEQGHLFLANMINLAIFPHVIEYRPVFIPEDDVPGWLPVCLDVGR